MQAEQQLDLDNKEWQDALQIINYTRRSLFLTGKAGTGKSTFLRYVSKNTKKKHVILAPTGIAAINAGGSTLHSFFKLPFHPLLPNDVQYSWKNLKKTLKYNGAQCKLIREVELIIIDEISMVRADIIDFIDKVLRAYTRNPEPFGGKQLLLVGDIYQLEPVLKDDDRQLLQPFYPSAYFFNAKVWQTMPIVSIELRKVYRQTDDKFIAIYFINTVIEAWVDSKIEVSWQGPRSRGPSEEVFVGVFNFKFNVGGWIGDGLVGVIIHGHFGLRNRRSELGVIH